MRGKAQQRSYSSKDDVNLAFFLSSSTNNFEIIHPFLKIVCSHRYTSVILMTFKILPFYSYNINVQTSTVEKMCWLNQGESVDSCQNPWNKIHKDCNQRPKLATKLVDTLCPKGALNITWLTKEKIKLFLPHPLHAMLSDCSSYLQKTKNTPTSNGGMGEGCGFFCSL